MMIRSHSEINDQQGQRQKKNNVSAANKLNALEIQFHHFQLNSTNVCMMMTMLKGHQSKNRSFRYTIVCDFYKNRHPVVKKRQHIYRIRAAHTAHMHSLFANGP